MKCPASAISTKDAQRLVQFRQHFLELEGRIAQHHIASYLGVTAVSLSRLKARERDTAR